ncbi:MAG: SPOR domain-containing protein [Henriciella sp.]|nr:SPOR domain-containing protein [Henriciella sp.]
MSRVSDGSDYDFGPYEDEYRGFEIRDDDSGRGPLILVLALGVLLIFAGVVWNTYRQGVRPTQGGLPVIASDDAPYKRAPDERGGLEVAGQDSGFYGQMDGLGDPALTQKTSVRSPVAIRRTPPTLSGAPSDLPQIVDTVVAEAPVRSAALDGLDDREPAATKTEPVQTASLKPIDLTPHRQTLADVAPLPPEPVMAASRFASTGAYQVQLMAVRSEVAAQSAWSKVKSRSPDLFRGAKLNIQRADLGAKGVYFRLRIGSFETRETAKAFCTDVKAAGKDCIVVAKASG